MAKKLLRNKWLILAVLIITLIFSTLLLTLRIDYSQKQDSVLTYFSQQQGMPETFAKLENLTTQDSIILCWWDYGRAVQQWSHRQPIESYPSRDIWYTMASSRDPIHNLESQLFGTWGSSEKIHDIARTFLMPEDQSLQIMRNYNVTHILVFTPDELQKFGWIAQITGYNATEYLTTNGTTYQPTAKGTQTTLLRLLFDDTLHPTHFIKLYDNGKGKIYQVNYP
jgi:hypothetical protein